MLVGWLVLLFWPNPKEGAGLVVPFVNGASPSLVQHEILRPAPPDSSPTPLKEALSRRRPHRRIQPGGGREVTVEGPGA